MRSELSPARGIAVVMMVVSAIALSACAANPSPSSPSPSSTASTRTATPTSTPTHTVVPPLVSPTPQPTFQPDPVASSAAPALTIADLDIDGRNVSASGYVAGIAEDGGSCLFSFTMGSTRVERPTTGMSDSRNVSCGFVQVPVSQLTSGQWTISLAYTSLAGSISRAEPRTVAVP